MVYENPQAASDWERKLRSDIRRARDRRRLLRRLRRVILGAAAALGILVAGVQCAPAGEAAPAAASTPQSNVRGEMTL